MIAPQNPLCPNLPSPSRPQFLADYTPQRFLDRRFLPSLEIGAQRIVDQGLIVAAPCMVDGVPEIFQNVSVQADRSMLTIKGRGPT